MSMGAALTVDEISRIKSYHKDIQGYALRILDDVDDAAAQIREYIYREIEFLTHKHLYPTPSEIDPAIKEATTFTKAEIFGVNFATQREMPL